MQLLALGAGGGSAAVPQNTTGGRRLVRSEEWGSRSMLAFGDCGVCGREAWQCVFLFCFLFTHVISTWLFEQVSIQDFEKASPQKTYLL